MVSASGVFGIELQVLLQEPVLFFVNRDEALHGFEHTDPLIGEIVSGVRPRMAGRTGRDIHLFGIIPELLFV